MNATIETISEERHNSRQGYTLTRILKAFKYGPPVQRLRIEVYRDSYDFQSYARVSLWDGSRWNVVESLSGTNPIMHGPPPGIWNDQREACTQWQDKIAQHLLDTALLVVLNGC